MSKPLFTIGGYNMYDMMSLLQKALRRGDFEKAGFAGYQLFKSFYHLAWRRIIVVSAEDCDGVITKEIMALRDACEFMNKNTQNKSAIFYSKALMLLAKHPKNRDADYFVCNYMHDVNPIPHDDVETADISTIQLDVIPDYTYDVHTLKGKRMGKKIEDMIETEQRDLHPKQIGLFDDSPWDTFLDVIASGAWGEKAAQKTRRYKPNK